MPLSILILKGAVIMCVVIPFSLMTHISLSTHKVMSRGFAYWYLINTPLSQIVIGWCVSKPCSQTRMSVALISVIVLFNVSNEFRVDLLRTQ